MLFIRCLAILMRAVPALCFCFAVAQAAGQTVPDPLAPIYTEVVPGLVYAHVTDTNRPWSIHVLRLERGRADIGLSTTLAGNRIVGLATVARQTAEFPPAQGIPVAAINGDFYEIRPGPFQGDPLGLHILETELVSSPKNQSFWIDRGGRFRVGEVANRMRVVLPNGKSFPLGLGEAPRANQATLFTPRFGPSTRATNQLEVVLERQGKGPWLPLQPNQTYAARARSLQPAGNSLIAEDAMILTIGSNLVPAWAGLNPGAPVRIVTELKPSLKGARTALGGYPILVADAKINRALLSNRKQPSAAPRHPRTAIGFNNRHFFAVEVDGRKKDLSVGMTFLELAAYMQSLGCREALNLDGGGSSTMWVNGRVVNSPSDKRERAVANSLVILRTRR